MLFFTSCLVLRCYSKNAIRIHIKCNLNLRDTSWCRGNAIKIEYTDLSIIFSHRTITLKNHNLYTWLIIHCCTENFRLLGRNCCISFDKCCHDVAHCLNTQTQWRYIKQKNILIISCKDTSLNCGTHRNCLIRICCFYQLYAKCFLQLLLNIWNTS